MKVLWIDTETTGLDPVKNGIIQLAGIIEIDNVVKEEFDYLIRPFPSDEMSDEALAISGTAKEELLTSPSYISPITVYRQFIVMLSKYVDKFDKNDKFIPAGQNVKFDTDFMRAFFVKNTDKYFGSFVGGQAIDLMPFAMLLKYLGIIEVENCKLETLAKYIGKDFKAHNALEDIKMTRIVLKELTDRFIKKI